MKKGLYVVPSHKYGLGTFINNVQGSVDQDTGKYTGGLFNGMSEGLGNAMGAIGSAVGGVAGGLIGGGRTSAAGDIIGGLGKVASAIPGPWGAIAGVGLGAISGLTNAAFGVKLNQENINAVNNNITALNSFQSNAGNFDALTQNFMSQPTSMRFNQDFIGKNGWFNKGATKKYNELVAKQDVAQQFVDNSLINNMNNIASTQSQNLLANYAALGGSLSSNGTDWNTGLNYVGNGGSHEENPYDGVPMGIAPDGLPNLVEEGEVIWNNDYVFSKRLKVPKAVRRKYKLGGLKPLSFADAVMKVNKDVEERPNDPIAIRGRDAILGALAEVQEIQRTKKEDKEQQEIVSMLQGIHPMAAANGGTIHINKNKRGTFTAAASKHGMGVQEFASQVLANPKNYSPAMRKKANFARNAAKWHGNGGHLLPDGSFIMKYPFYDKEDRYLNGEKPVFGPWYNDLPVVVGDGTQVYSSSPSSWNTHYIPGTNNVNNKTETNKTRASWLSGLRYAPVIGSALGVFSDLMGWTNKPDYSSADAILEASKGVRDVSFTPIGDYMSYNPFDRMFYLNQLNANASATRRALTNQAAGNRGTAMAGILAADNNMMNSIGQLARQAEEYNLAQKQKTAEFNRATNMFNSELDLKAQEANLGASEVRMRAAQAAAALRDAIDQRIGTARSLNLTNLFESLGDIGREEAAKDMIRGNRGLLYDWLGNYKGILSSNGGKLVTKNKRRRK